MIAIIYRTYAEKQTTGNFYIVAPDGAFYRMHTLELPWKNNKSFISCIHEGVYNCIPRKSKLFGDHFLIENVKGRDKILFHHLNYIGSVHPITKIIESNGCIGVGMQLQDITGDGIKDLTYSLKGMGMLNTIMQNKPFTLVIKSTNPEYIIY